MISMFVGGYARIKLLLEIKGAKSFFISAEFANFKDMS